MAEQLDIRENEMQQINNPTFLRCVDSAGNSGLISTTEITKNLSYIFSFDGKNLGDSNKKWFGLGEFHSDAYVPIRLNLSIGAYASTSRVILDVTLTNHGDMYVSGSGLGKIGYVVNGDKVKVYVMRNPGESYIGFCFGWFLADVPDATTEPSGIVYVP